MAAKLLFLYLLAVTGLGVVPSLVRASKSASWRLINLIRPIRWFVDGVREIAPVILEQRDVCSNSTLSQGQNTDITQSTNNGTAPTARSLPHFG
jgi:hypothetical protein